MSRLHESSRNAAADDLTYCDLLAAKGRLKTHVRVSEEGPSFALPTKCDVTPTKSTPPAARRHYDVIPDTPDPAELAVVPEVGLLTCRAIVLQKCPPCRVSENGWANRNEHGAHH